VSEGYATPAQKTLADKTSPCENWLRKNCRLCPPNPASHPSTEDCSCPSALIYFNLMSNKLTFSTQVDPSSKATTALILVPTRELAEQVQKVITSFASFCGKDIRSVNLTQKVSDEVQRSILADFPDIVVSTPTRVYSNVNNSALTLDNITHLVIDEADLVLSYGYDEEINALAKAIPRGAQTFLMSATLTSEVDTLKDLYCRNPVILKLEEKEEKGAGVSQFIVR
jgi:ATP-dependent RNA helicase DDX56/DBP9